MTKSLIHGELSKRSAVIKLLKKDPSVHLRRDNICVTSWMVESKEPQPEKLGNQLSAHGHVLPTPTNAVMGASVRDLLLLSHVRSVEIRLVLHLLLTLISCLHRPLGICSSRV